MTNKPLEGKRILITGGTGSLGKKVVRRLLTEEMGHPERIIVFSRDEAKQHYMRLAYLENSSATDDIIYRNFKDLLSFRIGDVRDEHSVLSSLRDADIVIHAAALKQVPTCEYFPAQAVMTNIQGAINIVNAIRENDLPIETVVGISTDKACKPINVMGMTKAMMERIFNEANIGSQTRFIGVRYGNVIASRGSVVPLFMDQIEKGGPITITLEEMTRFLLSLDQAVDIVFAAIRNANPGEIYVPQVPAARIVDLALAMINGRDIDIKYTGIRPGEKIHEVLVSEEESYRTLERDNYYIICPMLPELNPAILDGKRSLTSEYSSSQITLNVEDLKNLLESYTDTELYGTENA